MTPEQSNQAAGPDVRLARHTGQAELTRESIDGLVGEGIPEEV